LFFKFALEYAIKWVPENQDGLKLNVIHQLLDYDDFNKLGGSVLSTDKNMLTSVVVSKEVGLVVCVRKTMYMVMSRDRNAVQRNNIKNNTSTIEKVEEFKYIGTTLKIKILFRKKLRAD
jgi:hypothetical protein